MRVGDTIPSFTRLDSRNSAYFYPGEICCVRLLVHMWHDSAHQDGEDDPCQDSEAPDYLNLWKCPIEVENDEDRNPCDEDVGDENMPLLRHKSIMHHSIHGHYLRRHNLDDRGSLVLSLGRGDKVAFQTFRHCSLRRADQMPRANEERLDTQFIT